MLSSLKLEIEHSKVFSLAAQRNAYPLFKNLRLYYPVPDGDDKADYKPLRDIVIKLETDSNYLKPEEWLVQEILPDQSIVLQERSFRIPQNVLRETEEVTLEVTISVYSEEKPDEPCELQKLEIILLPRNYWGGESRQPELLAAFVQPNGAYVESLVRKVAELLERNGHDGIVDGYQSNTRDKPYLMVAVLWNVIFSERIHYVEPPPTFAHQGQRVRLAADISTSKIGACLDISLLFASCLELMGLNPVIALTKEHATVGVWLIKESFTVPTNDDPMELRKRVGGRDMVLFESTLVTNKSGPITFNQSIEDARQLISGKNEGEFVYVVDIKQARRVGINPLSTTEEAPTEKASDADNVELDFPLPPPLPPVRRDEQITEETPITRVDRWLRKLLDLTKRNPLLAFKNRAAAIPIYCPNIARMEDLLAKNNTFEFLSAEKSPYNKNDERSSNLFQLQSGDNAHKKHASEQLENNVLIANMSEEDYKRNAISLLRKAKNDLEEGGANTLYLALGMLHWKENPRDTRSYRAPLILIPVQLTRRSAGAAIKLIQLPDEQPIFNTTLIEFLINDYAIDLNQFREELPKDESGINVHEVWDIVREAVLEQNGFEVVEDLVLASFSFAKYLMWKDIKDRTNDLRENIFVNHLIDNPQEPYAQKAEFIAQNEVDEKIDPAEIFTPLNCDSSQLAAVEASGKPQDFILEGPPGTGKSETIANIICHNLALGRKVLFVAEKMAALNIVYHRMKKIRLEHLCLELHSNKAGKKDVLNQLAAARTTHSEVSSDEWNKCIRSLKEKRDRLNNFVNALHKKSAYGLSARDAIARTARYKDKHKLELGWLSWKDKEPPIKNKDQLDNMLKEAKSIALAYNDIATLDVANFRIMNARGWSYAWQSKAVDCLQRYKSALENLQANAETLSANFGIEPNEKTLTNISRVNSLASLIDVASTHSVGYLTQEKIGVFLDKLQQLHDKKKEFDALCESIAHNISPDILAETPAKEWNELYKQAKDGWLKHTFAKIKINRAAKKLGYKKFDNLEVLSNIHRAVELHKEISALADAYKADKIWQGWNTVASDLEQSLARVKTARKALANALRLTNDSATLHTNIIKHLVNEHDLLPDNAELLGQKDDFMKQWDVYVQAENDAKKQGLNFDSNQDTPFEQLTATIDFLLGNKGNFKVWCKWLSAKDKAQDYHLDALTRSLESQTFSSKESKEQVLTAFCHWLAPQLIDGNNDLLSFSASEHKEIICEFQKVDEKIAKMTGAHVKGIVAKQSPNMSAQSPPEGLGALDRELNRTTRHMPVRKLIREMGTCLLDLCPCMMMSPLSVAQFLPADFKGFDLVVFDEASQITPWDAVGAIARGKNVIVVGDSNQMPPTNFFNKSVDEENPDEEDLESILDQALAARLPKLQLTGHYRSRHESLIAFSNNQYYKNALITYPSSDTKRSAVSLHRTNGVYAKGKGRNNPAEAKAVVDEIVKRLKDPELRKQTIGVVTLNSEQQRTIEDLLETARRGDTEIEQCFHSTDEYDGVFVKNLESVQGDERNVIILSLGYGPTEEGSKTMSMNFGPLNKVGGERRLNVAVTRATDEVLVFSSFDSSMIDLSRSSALGVKRLKLYLEFAERGPIALAEHATATHGVDQFDSDFEESVAEDLRRMKWKVQTQVGVGKFRVDLGIIHPDFPGKYLAGIECDGARYHSSPSARDRDRVRHIILNNLGWELIRLWSTDYFHDPDAALERIDVRLKKILADSKITPLPQDDSGEKTAETPS